MASLFGELLPPSQLSASQKMDTKDVLDLGAYSVLQIQPRVLTAGGAGNLKIQHSSRNIDGTFVDLASVALNATSNTLVTVTNFLRYVRWVTDGAVAGTPVAACDIVAKER